VTVWPVTESREDDSLVSAARDGDRVAFGRLYARMPGWSTASSRSGTATEVMTLSKRCFSRRCAQLHARATALVLSLAGDHYQKLPMTIRKLSQSAVNGTVSENTRKPGRAPRREQEAKAILAVIGLFRNLIVNRSSFGWWRA